MRGKGDVKGQKRRRKLRNKARKPQPFKAELIDGNMSRFFIAYCTFKKGYLTRGLMDTHGCEARECKSLRIIEKPPNPSQGSDFADKND